MVKPSWNHHSCLIVGIMVASDKGRKVHPPQDQGRHLPGQGLQRGLCARPSQLQHCQPHYEGQHSGERPGHPDRARLIYDSR